MNFYQRFIMLCNEIAKSPSKVAIENGISKPTVTKWKSGGMPTDANALKLANYFGVTVDYLLNGEDNGVSIADDFVSFPVIGEVAAGYDHIASEDWEGDTVNIPQSYLKGRAKEDFFVLRVTGNSMYPTYVDGDKVLVLKQSTLNHSGQVGVVLYNGDTGTIKRVEFVAGENWMKLVPINPNYPPIKIENADLENCRVLGIPKLLIREIDE